MREEAADRKRRRGRGKGAREGEGPHLSIAPDRARVRGHDEAHMATQDVVCQISPAPVCGDASLGTEAGEKRRADTGYLFQQPRSVRAGVARGLDEGTLAHVVRWEGVSEGKDLPVLRASVGVMLFGPFLPGGPRDLQGVC